MVTSLEKLPPTPPKSARSLKSSSTSPADDFEAWLAERPTWLTSLVPQLLRTGEPPPGSELPGLAALCKAEALHTKVSCSADDGSETAAGSTPQAVRIRVLRDVHGVNAIRDGATLNFGTENIAVIYGDNGAGKSGFSRILKQACGSRAKEDLLPNVFKSECPPPSATFEISIDGVTESIPWSLAGGPLKALGNAQTFDSCTANLYMRSANEATYEPQRMRLLTLMAVTCDEVSRCLVADKEKLVSSLPSLPADFENTSAHAFLASLSAKTTLTQIDARCQFGNDSRDELLSVASTLSVHDLDARIEAVSRERGAVGALKTSLITLKTGLSDDAIAAIVSVTIKAEEARTAAIEAARVTFGTAPLSGIGEATWRGLWEQARKYSESHAYPGRAFPVTENGDLCVLCQQPLTQSAAQRLQYFESFVKAGLEGEAQRAERRQSELLSALPQLPDLAGWVVQLSLLRIPDHSARSLHADLAARSRAAGSARALGDVPSFDWNPLETSLGTIEHEVASQLQSLSELAQTESRQRLESRLRELKAQQWLHENKAAIVAEVGRLTKVAEFDKALQLTKTNALTAKKNELAMKELTAGYQERFARELQLLGGDRIPVEPIVDKKGKAKISFSLALKAPKPGVAAQSILSEGESRIVGLAAFLADITGIEQSTPFIFDDPISSLDQRYEQRVVGRLVNLARTRQVIVFTHRLSLLNLIDSAVEAASGLTLHVETLHRFNGTCGIVQPPSVRDIKPKAALNDLKFDGLAQLRKMQAAGNLDGYRREAQAMCTNLRIIVENCVEKVLLSDVVRRFRPSIQTKQIGSLARITASDCRMLEDLMARYSAHEHSQPDETPAEMPDIETLTKDISKLLDWVMAFDKRPIPQSP